MSSTKTPSGHERPVAVAPFEVDLNAPPGLCSGRAGSRVPVGRSSLLESTSHTHEDRGRGRLRRRPAVPRLPFAGTPRTGRLTWAAFH